MQAKVNCTITSNTETKKKANSLAVKEMRVCFIEVTIFRVRHYMKIPLFPIACIIDEQLTPCAPMLSPVGKGAYTSTLDGQVAMAKWLDTILVTGNNAKKGGLRKYCYGLCTSTGTTVQRICVTTQVRSHAAGLVACFISVFFV